MPGSGPGAALPHTVPSADNPTGAHPGLDATFFEQLFLHSYDATLVTDLTGQVLEANQRAKEFLLRSREDLCRMRIIDCISGADDSLVANLCEMLAVERYARIYAWCQRSDGSFFPAEIAVHCIAVDTLRHLCFFIRDITWRREAEGELRTVHTAIKNARTGIAIADLDGLLIYANPAMAGLCQCAGDEELRTRPLSQLVREPATVAAILTAVREGRSWSGELTLQRQDGSGLEVQASATVNVDTEEQVIGMVLSFVDISDRRRAEQAERAVERNRVMMESLGSVCHHLGQPSTVLLSSIEMMIRLRERDPRALEELLQLSLSAAEGLRTTLRELNDLRQYRSEPYLASSNPEGQRIVSLPQAGAGEAPGDVSGTWQPGQAQ